MRIKSLRVNQLHGFLDIELLLLDDLTIVVGANGTGKTSALLILSAMLRLDGKAMRAIKYSSAVLQLDDEVMGAIELISENADDFLISIKCRGDLVNLAPYFRTEPLLYKRAAGRAVSLYDRNALTALLQHSGIDESERSDAVRLAKQFLERAKLTFVQLDRSIVTRDPLGKSSVDSIAEYVVEKSRNSSIGDPIDEVIRVTKEKYLEYKNVVERVKDRAYLDSLSLHFKRIDPVLNEKKMVTTQPP